MKKYSVIKWSAVISVLFILLTGWISFSHPIPILYKFSFIFHLVTFGIGFSGGSTILIYVYYFFLWVGLSLLISPIVQSFHLTKNKTKFLTVCLTPLILIIAIATYKDYSKNKKREELIAKDKIEFCHLRTGDILFQRINKDSILTDSINSNNSYNSIGIAFVDGQNYTLLETKNKVQYVSMRQWIEDGRNSNYVAKRLKNTDSLLTNSGIKKLRKEISNHIMKKYDNSSDWSDEKMYNAELIWKIYKRSINVKLGLLDTIKINSVSNLEIKPNTIFNSENLITVKRK